MSEKKRLEAEYRKTIITPATIQKALMDARAGLSDRDIFCSAAYQRQLSSLGAYLVGRTGRKDIHALPRVIWDEKPNAVTAYTNNITVVINAAYPAIQKLSRRSDRNYCVMGLACHEFAHCLFTDFSLLKTQWETWTSGNIYPPRYRVTSQNEHGLEGIQAALKKGPRTCKAIATLYQDLDNVLEDAYIERSIVLLHPGDTKKSLRILNQALFGGDFMEPLRENPDYAKMRWSVFQNALLTLLEIGSVEIDPMFSEELADIHDRIARLAPRVNREVENSNVLARKELALDIMAENWDLIEEQLNQETQPGQELQDLSDEELAGLLEEILQTILEGAGSDHQNHPDSNSGRPLRVFIELPSPSQSEDQEGEGSGPSGGNGQDGESEAEGNSGDTKQAAQESGSEDNNQTADATIRIEPASDAGSSDGSFGKILNNVETDLAKDAAHEKVENQLKDTLQRNANESAEGDDYRIVVDRSPSVPEAGVRRYEYIWPKISPVSKSLKKELLKILRDRRRGTKLTGLAYGRRLDTRSLYRTDEKYFTKNRLPNDRPQVATALLIDQSGSMCSSAVDSSGQNLFQTKIQAASNAALVLYDFCVDLDFPVMVAGHTVAWGNRSVVMEVMAPFQKVDKEDKYRICAAQALDGNRDGTALNYMLSELKKRPEDLKLLFIISDGLPADYRSMEEGVAHLKAVMEDAKKSGVLVFAAALDEDIPQLREIYGENLFEVSDLARMPKTLLNTMKRFIK